jgi:Grx4 family monothiol glutaredoxin
VREISAASADGINDNDRIIELVRSSSVMLFMKGEPNAPRCGFSRKMVDLLQSHEVIFSSFDILTDDAVRAGLKVLFNWPTYPQLYVNGALVGGLDILTEMVQDTSVSLKEQLGISNDPSQVSYIEATSSADFLEAGNQFLEWIVKYREDIVPSLPVISQVEPNYLARALPLESPKTAEPWSAIFSDIDEHIVPGLTHWESSSKFFAYFKPHASYPSVLGEMLCAGLNVIF